MTETHLQGPSEFDMSLAQLVARDGELKPAFGYIAAAKATRLVRAAPGGCISPSELAGADGFLAGLEDDGVLREFLRFGSFATIEIGGEELLCERSAVVRTAAVVLPRYQSRFERAALDLPVSSPVRKAQGLGMPPQPLCRLSGEGLTNRVVASALKDLRRVDDVSGGVVRDIAAAVSGRLGEADPVSPPALRAGVKYLGWLRTDLLALIAAGYLEEPLAIEASEGQDGRPRRIRLWRRMPDEPLVRPIEGRAGAKAPPSTEPAVPSVIAMPPPTVAAVDAKGPAGRIRIATNARLGPVGALAISALAARTIRERAVVGGLRSRGGVRRRGSRGP